MREGFGGATMTTPGGRAHSAESFMCRPRARRTGFSHRVGAFSVLGSGPSLCPGPMPQGVSYVHHANLYIRNIIPIRAPAGLSRVQSKPLPGRARISCPPAGPDLFHPTSGKRNSANFAITEFSEVRSIEEGRGSSFQSPGLLGLSSQSWLANYYGPPSAVWHDSSSGVAGSSGWQPLRASSLVLSSGRGATVGSALE